MENKNAALSFKPSEQLFHVVLPVPTGKTLLQSLLTDEQFASPTFEMVSSHTGVKHLL